MPQAKKKKVQDSDSSDTSLNSDDDSKKQPAKKAKTDTKASKSSSSGNSGEIAFDIDARKQVKVRQFKNHLYVDIREYYEDKNTGDIRPTKKGISLTVESWKKLCSLIPDIDEAIKKKV